MENLLAKSPRIAIGIDIIEIQRIEHAILTWQDSFLKRIYTMNELTKYRYITSSLAARFAAKEAVMKALGTGNKGLNWRDIEVLSDADGAPLIHLHGRAKEEAKKIGVKEFSVSISHNKQQAIALVVGNAI